MASTHQSEYSEQAVLNAAFDETNNHLNTGLNTALAGEDLTNNVMKTEERSTYLGGQTADVNVKIGSGRLFGIFFTAASATPTCKIWDNTAGSGTVIVDTFTPVAATMYTFPGVEFSTGLFVDIGGTVNYTVFFK